MLRLLLLLLGLLPALAHAQGFVDEDFEAALLPAKDGALLVFNGPRHAFTVRFTGQVKPADNPGFLFLDGQVVQATTIGFTSNGDVTSLPEDTQKKFLLSYQQREAAYFRDELNLKLGAQQTSYVRYGPHLFMAWELTVPAQSGRKAQQQLYLLSICYNQTLVLNCPVLAPRDAPRARRILAATAATLTLLDAPVDLTQRYKELNP